MYISIILFIFGIAILLFRNVIGRTFGIGAASVVKTIFKPQKDLYPLFSKLYTYGAICSGIVAILVGILGIIGNLQI